MATTRQIALLRGINLGSSRRVAMPKLRELLEERGYEDVRTHLQSGNVVLSAATTGTRLERELEQAIADGLGIETTVIVRTRAELAKVVARNPLADVAENPARYLVSFLSAKPAPAAVRRLEAMDVAPEQFVVHGREVYAWHPNGVQRSKLFKALADDALGVTATARNWNTVTRLLELASSPTSG
jgi:uncharacterized protein (DUF1697 family)